MISNDDIKGFINVFNVLKQLMDDASHWTVKGIVDEPKGKRQECDYPDYFEYEYVDQNNDEGYGGGYFGDMYFPISNNKFIKVSYTC